MAACREFAHRMNQVRDVEKHPELAVHAGKLYAMGLIDEASHVLMARYREQFDPEVMTAAWIGLPRRWARTSWTRCCWPLSSSFPAQSVMRGLETPRAMAGRADRMACRTAPPRWKSCCCCGRPTATRPSSPSRSFSRTRPLAEKTVYRQVTQQLPEYFATRPLIPLPGAKPMNLLDLLRAPAVGSPGSLQRSACAHPQALEAADRRQPGAAAADRRRDSARGRAGHLDAVQSARGQAARRRGATAREPVYRWSSAEVPVFGDPAHEYEKFSPDTAWMPARC